MLMEARIAQAPLHNKPRTFRPEAEVSLFIVIITFALLLLGLHL